MGTSSYNYLKVTSLFALHAYTLSMVKAEHIHEPLLARSFCHCMCICRSYLDSYIHFFFASSLFTFHVQFLYYFPSLHLFVISFVLYMCHMQHIVTAMWFYFYRMFLLISFAMNAYSATLPYWCDCVPAFDLNQPLFSAAIIREFIVFLNLWFFFCIIFVGLFRRILSSKGFHWTFCDSTNERDKKGIEKSICDGIQWRQFCLEISIPLHTNTGIDQIFVVVRSISVHIFTYGICMCVCVCRVHYYFSR